MNDNVIRACIETIDSADLGGYYAEAWQTLKAAVLAQQSTNKQSTLCTCTNSCVTTIYVCKDCGGRVNPK